MFKKTFFFAIILFAVVLQAWAQNKVESPRKNAEGKEEIVKLSAPAILVEAKQKNVLKLAENPTAEQLKLRNAWLKP